MGLVYPDELVVRYRQYNNSDTLQFKSDQIQSSIDQQSNHWNAGNDLFSIHFIRGIVSRSAPKRAKLKKIAFEIASLSTPFFPVTSVYCQFVFSKTPRKPDNAVSASLQTWKRKEKVSIVWSDSS